MGGGTLYSLHNNQRGGILYDIFLVDCHNGYSCQTCVQAVILKNVVGTVELLLVLFNSTTIHSW